MTTNSAATWTSAIRPGLGLLAVAGLAAACSSSSKSAAGSAPPSTRVPATSAASAVSASATIETHSGPLGTFLTDSAGHALYMFASDSATKSSCAGACAAIWPPLTPSGTVTVAGGATRTKITTIARTDGTRQIAYAGHPLYTFKEDTAAGDTNGQGSDGFGAKWWLLAASGLEITRANAATSASPSIRGY